MNKELKNIVTQYHKAVSDLFPRVAAHLDVSLPITHNEWTCIGKDQKGETVDGIKYFIHGYGVTMNDGFVQVDFDLRDDGQIDGIDPWKLFEFVRTNNIHCSFADRKGIECALKEAESLNQITYSGYLLYYLNAE